MLTNQLFENTPATLFKLLERADNVYQLIAHIFHDDGDMMTIFLAEDELGNVRIFDHGMSLMRLSYTFDLDTDKKNKILNDLILSKSAENYDGNICLTVKRAQIFSGIMSFSQLVNQICNLDILSRDTITELFYDNLNATIDECLSMYKYQKGFYVPQYNDMPIDYVFSAENKKPIYLFGVKDTNKAQQTTICLLQLAKRNISFKSVVVFDNLDIGVTKFARNSIINTVGKVFSDINGFRENGQKYFEEELTA